MAQFNKDGLQFGLEEPRRLGLLVASISERANNIPIKGSQLQLPSFRLSFPLPTTPSKQISSSGPASHRSTPRTALKLENASAEVQRVAALVGSVVIAGISKAINHVANSRPDTRNSLPFYQSFSFPWGHHRHTNIKQRSRESEELAKNLIIRGQEYERALDIRAAVQCFEEATRLSPTNLVSLCMAAKQWSDLTFYHDVRSDRERQLVNMKALEYAERAIAEHPDHPGGYLSTCISKGRLALFMDNKTKIKLAKEAQDAARTALHLGPDSDIAHHLMGRWHYEMAKLNVVVRTVVRVMYGTTLSPGSKEEALEAYQTAIKLAPQRLVHHAEAGRVLVELGEHERAREYLETALTCDVGDINDWHTRMDVEELLSRIDRRPWKQPSMIPPGASQRTPAALSTAVLLGVPENILHGDDVKK